MYTTEENDTKDHNLWLISFYSILQQSYDVFFQNCKVKSRKMQFWWTAPPIIEASSEYGVVAARQHCFGAGASIFDYILYMTQKNKLIDYKADTPQKLLTFFCPWIYDFRKWHHSFAKAKFFYSRIKLKRDGFGYKLEWNI